MNPKFRWRALAVPLLIISGCDPPSEKPAPVTDQEVAAARETAQAAFGRLSGALSEAMAEGGPGSAIALCSTQAVEIAREVGQAHGMDVIRLSDRPRNPDQGASGDDATAMEAFRADIAGGRPPKPSATRAGDGSAVVRIPILLSNPLCLKCHGDPDQMDPEIKDRLRDVYPDDKATGYALNELRGMWRVTIPPKTDD
ncbi:Tll0287-like domain-containing protein [Haloferula sargassicola]|uniref:Tll0287-like domain-containing protein n=1 Tax=Haloferula sargassicola TaxID=490096 RepID=A0ABP9UML7_9BACT